MNCDFQCLNKNFFSYFLAFCDPNTQTSIINYFWKNLTDTKLYLLICITVHVYKRFFKDLHEQVTIFLDYSCKAQFFTLPPF